MPKFMPRPPWVVHVSSIASEEHASFVERGRYALMNLVEVAVDDLIRLAAREELA
jgi:hypothetical protein